MGSDHSPIQKLNLMILTNGKLYKESLYTVENVFTTLTVYVNSII